jgi:symplekin
MRRLWPLFPETTLFCQYRTSKLNLQVSSIDYSAFSKKISGMRINRLILLAQTMLMQPSDALLVNATLNCLAPLIRTRQSIANKIINAVLEFYPAKHVRPPFTPTVRVSVKSMERTARALLINVLKKYAVIMVAKDVI